MFRVNLEPQFNEEDDDCGLIDLTQSSPAHCSLTPPPHTSVDSYRLREDSAGEDSAEEAAEAKNNSNLLSEEGNESRDLVADLLRIKDQLTARVDLKVTYSHLNLIIMGISFQKIVSIV
jgi:hypothetical protein